jgi:hypothetical protein
MAVFSPYDPNDSETVPELSLIAFMHAVVELLKNEEDCCHWAFSPKVIVVEDDTLEPTKVRVKLSISVEPDPDVITEAFP